MYVYTMGKVAIQAFKELYKKKRRQDRDGGVCCELKREGRSYMTS